MLVHANCSVSNVTSVLEPQGLCYKYEINKPFCWAEKPSRESWLWDWVWKTVKEKRKLIGHLLTKFASDKKGRKKEKQNWKDRKSKERKEQNKKRRRKENKREELNTYLSSLHDISGSISRKKSER